MAEQVQEPKAQIKPNLIAELYTGTEENTLFKSPLVSDSFRPPYNSDDLWQKKGDYSIYEKMVQDDQVSVCLQLKKDLVLGDGAMFVSGDDGQEEIIKNLESVFFEDYEGDLDNDLEEMCSCYEFGFSITEKIFKLMPDNTLALKGLKTRHPNSWRLYQDKYGNVEKFEQVTIDGNLEINPKSIIHFVNSPKFQNPYGASDLRSCYAAWFTKTQIISYLGIFLEKAASPVPVARYDKNAPQAAIDKIFNSLKSFQTKTALAIPKELEVMFLEAKNTGDAYNKAIHLFNMFIGRSLFIPDLVGFTGSETGGGAYALGKEQMNLFFKHIIRRRNNLEGIINKHLIKPIVQYNFGDVESPPKFKFKPLDDMQAIELAKSWLEAVKGKVYQPNPEEINYFRKLVKFPEGEVEFVQAAPSPFGSPTGENKNPMDENGNESDNEEDATSNEQEDSDENKQKDSQENLPGKNGKEDDSKEKKQFAKPYGKPPGDYHKKVNFKAIETKLNDYDESLLNDSQKITKKMIVDLLDQVEKKKIIQNQNTERIDTLSLKYKKELKQIFKNSFMQLYKDSQSQAATELDKTNYTKPLMDDDFLKVIEDEAFKFVGDYEYGILKRTRTELIAAIKDGKPLSEVVNILDWDLNEMSAVQIERFARTKHTEVLNNARVDYFESTGVVAAYQYSAIMDKNTSEICSGLDGKIFEKGEQPIPPMHFNCRSTLVPITKYEEFKPTTSIRGQSVNDFIEENKGKGFSTK